LLLSLLPPSCIVTPVREVANKKISLSSAISYYFIISEFPSNMEMDIVSNSIVRRRSNLSNKASSRSSLVFSSTSVLYHEYIEVNNDKLEEDIREPINSSQLSYKNATNKDKSVSRMTDTFSTNRKQHESNMAPALKTVSQP